MIKVSIIEDHDYDIVQLVSNSHMLEVSNDAFHQNLKKITLPSVPTKKAGKHLFRRQELAFKHLFLIGHKT